MELRVSGLHRDYIGVILGLYRGLYYRDNGKENGNYYNLGKSGV